MPHATRSSDGERGGAGAAVVIGALAATAGIAIGFPALMAIGNIAAGMAREGWSAAIDAAAIDADSAILLLRTVRTALVIGVLACLLAWPMAWAMRGRRGVWTGVMLAPLLMPSYLAYAGWGLLRAPGTWTGDLLASSQPPPWSTEPGYWPLLAGDVLAIVGLAFWSWPLAGAVLASGVARIDSSVLDALRLEPGSVWQKRACVLAMMRRPTLAAVVVVALVMLGSAVPLHLAQLRTWAVHLWLTLDQTPAERHWAAWLSAWPLVLIAVIACAAVSPGLAGRRQGGESASSQPAPRPAGHLTTGSAGAVWLAAVVVPAVLFACFLPGWRAMHTFWLVHHGPFLTSLGLSAAMGVVGAAIAAAAWLGLSGGRTTDRIATACGAVFLVAGLLPGVLVGSATSSAWNAWPPLHWMGDSTLIVVLGHIARFGFVPILIGAFLARAEPAEERDARRLDGAEGLKGWLIACLPAGLGTVAAAGLAVGVLSFHEIEAAVILQPAGLDSFARQMLGFLHYAKMQELCAGALLTILVGVVGAVLAVICDRLAGVRWRR